MILPSAPYPRFLEAMTIDQADGLAQVYIEPLAALKPDAARVIDKMPLNFMHLGLIGLLLPDARVIHCRRDPMDTCLSCYMTDFSIGHEFAHDLRHLGHFHAQYDRLMKHWSTVLELRLLEVRYEDVVTDLEAQARRMIEFLGMRWSRPCLKFHQTRRHVATASVEEVRQPLYKSSIGRWKNYEAQLAAVWAGV